MRISLVLAIEFLKLYSTIFHYIVFVYSYAVNPSTLWTCLQNHDMHAMFVGDNT